MQLPLTKELMKRKIRLKSLKELDIDLSLITDKLLVDGLKSFSDSFDSLMRSLKVKVDKSNG